MLAIMSTIFHEFDVIVVGGGHAGIEAAHAAARRGARTALITISIDKIGWMPCNPAVGGVGKGHLVFELSALGGVMPQLCTQTYLQARMLNTRKGPAVQGLRLQIDKHAYNRAARAYIENSPHITTIMDMVTGLIHDTDKKTIIGVTTRTNTHIYARSVILTTGTFLQGLVHIGDVQYPSGRQGEEPSLSLSPFLKDTLGLTLARLKTGTPPRLLKSSIDYRNLEVQNGDPLEYLFEFEPHKAINKYPCYITHTNEKTHEIIRANLHKSAMYSGNITGIGPRYCPSIEDKVSRFADKLSHHIFIEPESAESPEVYPNGISTSLPLDIQYQFIRSIVGFEQAIIVRPGYAIEYDCVLPNQLTHGLEVKTAPGLFLAGQINGTTGYEEAAAQGVIAGINAVQRVREEAPILFDRNSSYMGVMVDDLVTMGVDEPYRMFTSRAERRLLLRQDNAFDRLADLAYQLQLITPEKYHKICAERAQITEITKKIDAQKNATEHHLLLTSDAHDPALREFIHQAAGDTLPERIILTISAQYRYAPYIIREQREIERTAHYQLLAIPNDLDITNIAGLSTELQQKLIKYRPQTIAQAAQIPGMTPAAISLLIFAIHRYQRETH